MVKKWQGHELYHSKAEWVAASNYDALEARLAEKQEAIGKAYFLLWTTPTHLKTVHRARRVLLDSMTKAEQHEVMGRYSANCSPALGDDAAPEHDFPTDSAEPRKDKAANLHARINEWAAHCEALEARLAEREETVRKFGTVQHKLLCRAEAAEARLAEVKRILATGLSHASQRNHIALLLEAADSASLTQEPKT